MNIFAAIAALACMAMATGGAMLLVLMFENQSHPNPLKELDRQDKRGWLMVLGCVLLVIGAVLLGALAGGA